MGLATRGMGLLAWLGGVALQLQQAQLWPASTLAALAAAALTVLLAVWCWPRRWPRHRRSRWLAALLVATACAGLGFATTAWRAQQRLDDRLNAALEGQDLLVTGVIAELPQPAANGTRFVLRTEVATLHGAPVQVPEFLSLGWWRSVDDDDVFAAPAEALRAGQRWRLPLRLRQPHGSFNPHGFDLELWLFERGIGGSGYVRSRPDSSALKLADKVGYPIERLRQHVRDAIQTSVADRVAAGVLAALAIGDQAAIDRAGWELFRNTGVAHLMSISGLHVTMFAWLAGALIGWLWRRHPRLPLACPAPLAARWGGLVAALGYALLAGFGVPAQRTVWMIAVVVLLRSAGLRWPVPLVLLLAALVVTLTDPWALLQPGFWLSFVAVALLVASEPAQTSSTAVAGWRSRAWRVLRGGLRTQAVATVGLAPLSLLFFQQLSVVGFAANLVAIPLVTLLVTPLALLGMLLPPLWLLAAWLVQGLSVLLQQLAGLPWAMWSSAAAPPWAVVCGLLAGALAVLPLPWRLRLLALPLMLPLLLPPLQRPGPGRFELVAADVGQGSAVLVRTQHHLLLFDTGPAYSPEADAGGRVLLPLLRARGERQIDLLMLSHRDSDHTGGAAALLAGLPVAMISSSLAADHALLQRGPPHRRCDAGQSWVWDGVRFDVLHPPAADHATAVKPNAISCVLRVQGDHGSALLAGDVEAAQEAALVQRGAGSISAESKPSGPGAGTQSLSAPRAQVPPLSAPRTQVPPLSAPRAEIPPLSALRAQIPPSSALRADVLLVPHHGSRTSSTAAFIDAVAPRVAVVQAAYRSRFGHPAPDVVARYESRGIAVIRSDRCGAWTLPPEGPAYCERQHSRRYWHHSAAGPSPE